MDTIVQLIQLLKRDTGLERIFTEEGASASEIAAFVQETGVQLPPSYVRFLESYNGQPSGSLLAFPPEHLQFLPLRQVLELWRALREFEDVEFLDEVEDEGRVRAVTYHRRRIPIAYYEAGVQYIFLDFIPGPNGELGQLIFNPTESSFFVIAKSFSDLLERYVALLKSGQVVVKKVPPELGGYFWFQTAQNTSLTLEEFRELSEAP